MKLGKKKLQELKENKIQFNELENRYFISSKDKFVEDENILFLLNENICSFQELVDKFKSIKDKEDDSYLYVLLENKELIKEVFENNKLSKDDLRYLLNKIDEWYELRCLCEKNTSLLKHILNEFILNKEDVDKFNRIIENDDWYKDMNIYTLFELIDYFNKNNEEILKLNELNKKVYLLNSFELTEDQRLELIEVLRDNEQAQSLLKQLVDNNLEDQYDFENLKELLTKDEKKKKNKLNF